MEAKSPHDNIDVLPNDVVSIPKAEMVYVIGAVHRSGGFVLSEKEKISVLQALSLAEGLDRSAATKDARILRPVPNSDTRDEIPVNLKQIMAGKSGDISLAANDILFIPESGAKNAITRGLEAALQIGTRRIADSTVTKWGGPPGLPIAWKVPMKLHKPMTPQPPDTHDLVPAKPEGYVEAPARYARDSIKTPLPVASSKYWNILRRRKGAVLLFAFTGVLLAVACSPSPKHPSTRRAPPSKSRP